MLKLSTNTIRQFSSRMVDLRSVLKTTGSIQHQKRQGNMENFCYCYSTTLEDSVVLESANTDWSVILSNQSSSKCDKQFMVQLFVSLLSSNPLKTPLILTPYQQGSLTSILKKETHEISPLALGGLPDTSQLAIKFTDHKSHSNHWYINCYCNPIITKSLEDSFRSLFDGTQIKIHFHSANTNTKANIVEMKLPSSCFLLPERTKLTTETITKILSHPKMLPFTTKSPQLPAELVGQSSPKVEKLYL